MARGAIIINTGLGQFIGGGEEEESGTHLDIIIRECTPERTDRKAVGHTPAKGDSSPIWRKEVDDMGDVRQCAFAVQGSTVCIKRPAELGVDERVEGDGEGGSVVVEGFACVRGAIGGEALK